MYVLYSTNCMNHAGLFMYWPLDLSGGSLQSYMGTNWEPQKLSYTVRRGCDWRVLLTRVWIKWRPDHNSHITQERLSHAVFWPLLRAHATTGDELQQAKGTADRCAKLVLPPTAYNHRHTLGVNGAVALAQLPVLLHRTEKKKFMSRLFIFCCRYFMTWKHCTIMWLSSAALAWRASQVFLHSVFWQLL